MVDIQKKNQLSDYFRQKYDHDIDWEDMKQMEISVNINGLNLDELSAEFTKMMNSFTPEMLNEWIEMDNERLKKDTENE